MFKKSALFVSLLLLLFLLETFVDQSDKFENLKLDVPEYLQHQNAFYRLNAVRDLGGIVRYVYVIISPSQNWRQRIEILHDFQQPLMDIKQRIALRNKAYQSQSVIYVDLAEKKQDLEAVVVYAPTERQANWQLNIARGLMVKNCGFVQYQYSITIAKSPRLTQMNKQQLVDYFKNNIINKQREHLDKLTWNWHCQSR